MCPQKPSRRFWGRNPGRYCVTGKCFLESPCGGLGGVPLRPPREPVTGSEPINGPAATSLGGHCVCRGHAFPGPSPLVTQCGRTTSAGHSCPTRGSSKGKRGLRASSLACALRRRLPPAQPFLPSLLPQISDLKHHGQKVPPAPVPLH